MATQPITVRVPTEKLDKLAALAEASEKTLTAVVLEAIGDYLGESRETVPSRLESLESEMREVQGKLRSLAN